MEKEKSENPESNNLKKEDEEVRNNVSVSDNKEENKIGESKEKEEEDEDDELDYFDPLNEKGELVIPLKTKNKFKKEDFDIISLSGKGAYGTVLKVNLKKDENKKFYAMKTMDILTLDRIKKLYQAYLECDILSQLNSPYIVEILGAFDERRKIYIVMEYLSKGDFSDFIRLNYPMKLETIQFYAAEIVNFLSYIQSKNIVHRDLKPENIMMNENWHLQVIDFATARILGKYFDKKKMVFKDDAISNDNNKKNEIKENQKNIDDDDLDINPRTDRRGLTFVGTAEYVSPEVLGDKPAGFGADIWALGIMIYQMFCGRTPFKEKTNYLIFRKIEELKIEYSSNVNITEEAKDLISKILVKEPSKRLGAGEKGTEYDINHLKAHPFFKGIDWDNLHNMTPPNSEDFDFLMKKVVKKNTISVLNNNVKNINSIKEEANENNKNKKNDTTEENDENKPIVLRKGYLDKKNPWFFTYNKRKVILDSTPKLVYIDPDKNVIKGEIILDKNFKITHVNDNIFDIVSPKRSFRFKATNGDSLVWEKSINDAIKDYAK
jgi:3-phosphoinositide dependent protein kinase-1